jgi:hypothetical protein
MKKIATILATTALLALVATSAFAANQIRISQVYGGGGSTTGTPSWQQDYVELFNGGATAVNVGNWAIEYGSSTGTWNNAGGSTYSSNYVLPSGTMIQPCGYLLVAFKLSTAVYTGTDLATVVTPDFYSTVTPISMSGTNGKVMLTHTLSGTAVACGAEGVVIEDKFAYGPSSTCAETTPTASLSTTTGAVRNVGGLTDTDSNVADFTVTTNPTPRNSASPHNVLGSCAPSPTLHSTWGQVKSIYR